MRKFIFFLLTIGSLAMMAVSLVALFTSVATLPGFIGCFVFTRMFLVSLSGLLPNVGDNNDFVR